ncbi:OmpA family protein [Pontibacter sp. G13]|uniref:OmpA family protein n=1 Tax=Pontibacter sp. G13 TaxID=3074898 RepID=UPI002889DB14|nr:OmpA family protein [Pontibacter sp. G13]WNJ16645.1 OmpA family protein [Pontibacter sp. G13]
MMKLSVTIFRAFVVVAAMGVISSCVSKKKYEEAVNKAAAEKSSLESSLAEAQEESERLKSEMAQLEQNLNMSKEEIAQLSETVKVNNTKVAGLQNAITEAFETYDQSQINVEERDGKLYITMANSILFDSGRDRLKSESKEVISTLAEVFKANQGLNILVEGHTDNDPVVIHKAKYKDNWQLSVARSLNVVRELEKMGVNPARMTASGKGDTQPIASNDSDEGKIANRRTEFVVAPKIDGLYRMYKDGFEGSTSGR